MRNAIYCTEYQPEKIGKSAVEQNRPVTYAKNQKFLFKDKRQTADKLLKIRGTVEDLIHHTIYQRIILRTDHKSEMRERLENFISFLTLNNLTQQLHIGNFNTALASDFLTALTNHLSCIYYQ